MHNKGIIEWQYLILFLKIDIESFSTLTFESLAIESFSIT